MAPLNLGIIGYGGFGPFIHRAWAQFDAVTVRAVGDADPRRQPGGVTFYTSWQELVADPPLDLVAVVTPPGAHAEIACTAMEAGKHVLVEKPLATTQEDARRMLAVRNRTGQVATVDYMLRFNPIVEAPRAWSWNGDFGRLRRVVVENYAQDEALLPEHWFWNHALSGGILVEHGVHFIDIVQACAAAPVRGVDGVSLQHNPNQTDRMMATVVYEDGLVAIHYHAFMRPGFFEQTSMRFVFDLAQLDVEGWIPLSGRVTALVRSETRPALARLPGFRATREEALGDGNHQPRRLRSGGETYEAEHLVEGVFALPMPKNRSLCSLLTKADDRRSRSHPRPVASDARHARRWPYEPRHCPACHRARPAGRMRSSVYSPRSLSILNEIRSASRTFLTPCAPSRYATSC